jgi:hypothetical protein
MTSAQKASEHNKGVGDHAPSQNFTLLKAFSKQVLFFTDFTSKKGTFSEHTFHKLASSFGAYFKIRVPLSY